MSLTVANLVTVTCFLSYLFLDLLKVNSASQGTRVLRLLLCLPGSLGCLDQWEALVKDCEVEERKKPGYFSYSLCLVLPSHCCITFMILASPRLFLPSVVSVSAESSNVNLAHALVFSSLL